MAGGFDGYYGTSLLDPTGGTVTTVTASVPLASSGGATPNISYANIADGTFVGNNTGAPAAPIAMTAAQVRTALGLAAIATSGSASDLSAGTLPVARLPAFTGGDVTSSAGSAVLSIAAASIPLSKLATQADQTLLGNVSGGVASPSALTKAQVQTMLFGALSSGLAYVTTTTGAVTAVTTTTGLTSTSSTLTNNLITGLAGGQTIIGGTANSESLTYSSTSSATKGKHIFGTTMGFVYDEGTGLASINTASPAAQMHIASNATAAARGIMVSQHNAGPQSAAIYVRKSRGTNAAPSIVSDGDFIFTFIPDAYDGSTYIQTCLVGFRINGTVAAGSVPTDFIVFTGPNGQGTEHFRVTSAGNATVGTGVLTSATDGFLYLSSSAGVPAATPTTLNTGTTNAVAADRTNTKMYMYVSSWVALNRDSKGADVASASTTTFTQTWTYYQTTGTTTINYMTFTGFENGNTLELYFPSALTLTNNAGSVPANTYALQLVGGVDASMGAGAST